MNLQCFQCNQDLGRGQEISRGEICPKCRADVRVCRNCRFYDPKVYNECREPQADRVQDRERANFCDYFSPQLGPRGGPSEKEQMLKAAEALFRKK